MAVVADANLLVALRSTDDRAPAVRQLYAQWAETGETVHAPSLVLYEIASGLTRLLAASNKKLLRLLEVAHEIKDKYGSSEKLAEALASKLGRAKDQAYLAKLVKLAQRTPARVLDLLRAAEGKHKAA